MTDTGIATAEWSNRLISLLTGKVLSLYTNNVPRSAAKAYPILKDALLNAMGLSQAMLHARMLHARILAPSKRDRRDMARRSAACREYG